MAKKSAATTADAAPAPAEGAAAKPYTVLARRYRSRDFGEVVGQEPIARTLQNAIAAGRTAHAYLFCGTRGVGKTSLARIFARALNRNAALSEGDEIGEAILRGEDLDVIEIDGASNRGIDDARDLIAGAGLAPTRGEFRIYIIDEVHMLTTPAFNALLKTMEEPPSHVKFILCTTEAHKVPQTIQSRCQRFYFRNIPTREIARHLGEVSRCEGIEVTEDVLLSVARLANGSMRDGLSLLDRLLAAADGRVDAAVLEAVFGLPRRRDPPRDRRGRGRRTAGRRAPPRRAAPRAGKRRRAGARTPRRAVPLDPRRLGRRAGQLPPRGRRIDARAGRGDRRANRSRVRRARDRALRRGRPQRARLERAARPVRRGGRATRALGALRLGGGAPCWGRRMGGWRRSGGGLLKKSR